MGERRFRLLPMAVDGARRRGGSAPGRGRGVDRRRADEGRELALSCSWPTRADSVPGLEQAGEASGGDRDEVRVEGGPDQAASFRPTASSVDLDGGRAEDDAPLGEIDLGRGTFREPSITPATSMTCRKAHLEDPVPHVEEIELGSPCPLRPRSWRSEVGDLADLGVGHPDRPVRRSSCRGPRRRSAEGRRQSHSANWARSLAPWTTPRRICHVAGIRLRELIELRWKKFYEPAWMLPSQGRRAIRLLGVLEPRSAVPLRSGDGAQRHLGQAARRG